MQTQTRHRSWWIAAAIAVAALAACGGANQDNHGQERFKERLGSIVEAASSRYGELGARAASLNLNTPLTDDFKAQMRATAVSDRRAADEIEALTPPQAAADIVQKLAVELRARADAFERAAGPTTITLQQLEDERAITEPGEQIDRMAQQLRKAGFLRDEHRHDEP